MPKKAQVPVTTRAAIQRINRKLKADRQVLKKARGNAAKEDVGDYYVIDTERNILMRSRVDLTQFGRTIGAIENWEEVE